MGLTAELLEQQTAALPPSADTEAALSFMKQPGLTQIVPPAEARATYLPAQHWLRIYRIRQEIIARNGDATYGFPSLLTALEKLPPLHPLTIAAFETNEGLAIFWSDQTGQLIGFVVMKGRTARQEQERLDWFRRNLT